MKKKGKHKFAYAFEIAASRKPTAQEVSVLKDVLSEQRYRFKEAPETAKKFLSIGEKKSDEALDLTERAAWTIISQMILNLDETLTRG